LNCLPPIKISFANRAFISRKYTVKFSNLVYFNLSQPVFNNFLGVLSYSSHYYIFYFLSKKLQFFCIFFFFLFSDFFYMEAQKWVTTISTDLEKFTQLPYLMQVALLFLKGHLLPVKTSYLSMKIPIVLLYGTCKIF